MSEPVSEPSTGADPVWFCKPTPTAADPYFGGTLNLSYNALDRHIVAGLGEQTAIYHDTVAATEKLSYVHLLEQVAAFGGGLTEFGVQAGDRVLIALPEGLDAAVAMLACARVGAIAVAVPPGPPDLDVHPMAKLVEATTPAVVVTDDQPMVDTALVSTKHQPDACVVRKGEADQLAEGRDVKWGVAMRIGRAAPAPCRELSAADPFCLTWQRDGDSAAAVVRSTGEKTAALGALTGRGLPSAAEMVAILSN